LIAPQTEGFLGADWAQMYSPTRFARWRLRLEADCAKHCVTSSNTGSGGKHQASKPPPPPPPPCLDRRRGDNCSSRNLYKMVQNSRRSIIISPCPISSHTHTHTHTSKAFWILPQTEITNHKTRTRRKRLPQKKRRMEPRSETQVGRHEKTMEVGFGGQEFLHTSERTIGPATPLPKSGSRRSPDSSSIGSASDLKFSISTSSLNLHQIPQLPQSKKAVFPHFQDSCCTRNTIRVVAGTLSNCSCCCCWAVIRKDWTKPKVLLKPTKQHFF